MQIGQSKIDSALVTDGVWTDFIIMGANREPVEVSLRMALADASLNRTYKAALKKVLEPFERMLTIYKKASDIPEALAKKVNEAGRRVFVEHVVLDWKGPTGPDNQALPYSADAALMLFEEYPELLAQAEAEASKFERYRVSLLEEAAGNSPSA